jgi:hypothetical protein
MRALVSLKLWPTYATAGSGRNSTSLLWRRWKLPMSWNSQGCPSSNRFLSYRTRHSDQPVVALTYVLPSMMRYHSCGVICCYWVLSRRQQSERFHMPRKWCGIPTANRPAKSNLPRSFKHLVRQEYWAFDDFPEQTLPLVHQTVRPVRHFRAINATACWFNQSLHSLEAVTGLWNPSLSPNPSSALAYLLPV